MKDSNYYQVQGWMINQLNLKGNELICYAVIYCFCQDEKSIYMGGVNYLKGWMNASEPTVLKALAGLTEKGLLEKEMAITETGKRYYYRVTKDSLVRCTGETKGSLERLTKGSLVDNINIIELNNKERKSVSNDTQKIEDELFTIFWDKYGYKKGKENAKKAWRKLNNEEKDLAIKAIDEYKEDCRRNQRQMKHPTTYLNQKTWEDDFSYDGMVDESEEEANLPEGMTIEDWERCHNWLAKYTPRISGLITPKAYVEMKELAQDKDLMAKILHYINDSDYRGDLVREFKRLIETGEYKESA